jgi:glycosyltransferase involved in cell wall biosynthesis
VASSNPANSPSISVIVPAMNEAENLKHVLPFIPDYVDEVILVDGHSTDGTVAEAQRLLPNIRIVPQHGKGKGSALRTGFAAARGDIIVMLDADGSTDPREIPAFVQKLTKGADFVKGSRFMTGGGTADMPRHRKMGNGAFVAMVRLLFGGGYTDLCYGYSAFWSWVVPILELDGTGFEIETMMNVRALRAGLTVAEVPSFEHARVFGVGRLRTIPDGIRVLKTIFRERARKSPQTWRDVTPARLATIMPINPTLAAVPIERSESHSWGEAVYSDASGIDPNAQESRVIG